MEKNEIATVKQPNQQMALISESLPETSKQFLKLHFGSKKVSEYDEDDIKSLYKLILALCKLIGVTEAPDNEIIILLINHIQEHHSDFSKEEIQRSFSLATAGKLGFEFKHWNRVTPQLFSSVLNGYKKYRSKELIKHMQNQEGRLLEERSKKSRVSPEQRYENLKRDSIARFEAYKKNKSLKENDRKEILDWGSILYDFLDRIGCISFSDKKKNEIMEKAKKIVIEEKRKEYKEYGKKGIGNIIREMEEGKPFSLITKAKQMALDIYFDSLIRSNSSVYSHMKELNVLNFQK